MPQPRSSREPSSALLERMHALYPSLIDLSLGRIERLLDALGRPQDRLPSVVHVAGTNGKGSLTAFVRSMAEGAGWRAHVFTSPHLVRFHERIALAGPGGAKPISEEALSELLARVEKANAGGPITFFEITTAAALLAFAETPAETVILETGLGGRLDATNVVARPAVTVIMPVSMDHMKHLGDTLAAIAGEKAGILKPGVPCVVARQEPEAFDVIAARARAVGAPLLAQGRDWDCFEQHGRLVFQTEDTLLDLPLPRLVGRHQIGNAGAAIAAARVLLGKDCSEAALAHGLTHAEWPARMQKLTNGPLNALVHPDTEIWLDGGHNPGAGIVLANTMAELEERAPRPLHLVTGLLERKDADGFLKPFAGLAEWTGTVAVPGSEASFSAEALAAIARGAGLPAEACKNVEDAIARSRAVAGRPVRLLICGSLYL
ncbi:MAG: folylpolyglutamate synthase/dihydrofolate synthase family protein, partial [Pseudomonadota bacterium]|nr:folylpolyglutamate synthase/dihydrofolate synthase family protein [Pseudomonadota bacterium]